MLRHVLVRALRALRRQAVYTATNVLGLAVGMTACLLIGLYINHELRFDTFHDAPETIVAMGVDGGFFVGQSRSTPYALGEVLAEDIPVVDAVVRTQSERPVVRGPSGTVAREQRLLKADASFFDVFDFPLERGNPATVLDDPQQVVLTNAMAEAFFGDADPVGRTLTIDGIDTPVTVAGIVRVPTTSTIAFDVLAPLALAPPARSVRTDWGRLQFHTYARLHRSADVSAFPETVRQATAAALERGDQGTAFQFAAIPLPDLYFSDFYTADGFRGQQRYIYLFGTLALLLLGIAAINYVNLVTAQAGRRARDVGVHKAMGAHRTQVAQHVLAETALLSLGALGVACLLTAIALPSFNALFGTSLTLWTASTLPVVAGLGAFVLLVSVAAGIYPAFVLSGFAPVRVLRSASGTTTQSGGWLRKGLVVTQFAVSAALILGTVVILQQLDYLQTKDLGFDSERVVTVDMEGVPAERQRALKREVLTHPGVQSATVGGAMPGGFRLFYRTSADRVSPAASAETDGLSVKPAQVDADYIETLGLEMAAGRSFSETRSTDPTQAYILNREAVEALGWTVEEAVGTPFTFARADGTPMGTVIGVVENFHIASLHSEIEPVVLQMEAARYAQSDGVLAARLAPGDIRAAMTHIESVMDAAAPGASFRYAFLDDEFDAMYRSEERLASIFAVFAGIAIFVACMGLFGLAAFAAQRRTKEIGIRKVLGASLADVMGLLSKEFALLVALALVVGAPVAYWAMQQWLQDFAYRISVGPAAFALTAGVAFSIAALSVSYHAIRAAQTDPARALRSE